MMNHVSKARVVSLILGYTGGYQPQYVRPYTLSTEQHKRNELLNRIDPNRPISPTTLGGETAGFVKPSIQVDTTMQLMMPGGWGAERLRWIATIEIQTMVGMIVQYLTGYTDHVGVSLQTQQLDPNMRFYINNSFQFRVDTTMQNGVPVRRLVPFRMNQVLVNYNYNGTQMMQSALIRPTDVLNFIGTAPVREQILNNNIAFESSTLTNRATLSNIVNANPTAYAARILDAQRSAFLDVEQYGQGFDNLAASAAEKVREDSQRVDPFLNMLMNNSEETLVGNDFTWADLVRIDNNVMRDEITKIFLRNSVMPSFVPQSFAPVDPNNSSTWDDARYIQQSATMLRDSIGSLMAENMFSSIAFSITNETGQFTEAFTGGNLFVADVNPEPFWYRFITRLKNEIISDLSFNNQTRFTLHAVCEFIGDIKMLLTINDQYGEFVSPTFCSSLMAPVLAGNQTSAQNIADGFYNLTNELQSAFNNRVAMANTNLSANYDNSDAIMNHIPF